MSHRKALVLLFAAGTLGALAVFAAFAERVVYAGKVLPGVYVDEIGVGGQRRSEAADTVARATPDLTRTPLRARAGDETLELDPSLVALTIDPVATGRRAYGAGRAYGPVEALTGPFVRRIRPQRVALVNSYDASRLEGLLDGWASDIDEGVVEGDLRFEGTDVVAIEPQAGTGLQRDPARRRLVRAFGRTDRSEEVVLPIGRVEPRLTRKAVQRAADRARKLLAANHDVDLSGTTVSITPTQLATMMGTRIDGRALDLTIDVEKLRVTLAPAAAALEVPPVDANWEIGRDGTVSVVASRDGRLVDYNAVAARILRGERKITAEIKEVRPARDTKWAESLGITRQVASFTTKHPAGQPRVKNIHLGADVLDDTVVEPGKVFSLNDTLGPRTAEKGYVKAPILVQDGFGEDYGGGVSQLATTLYNATFFGGYEDVEHTPHLFYITRYPMGREATLAFPGIDLKFRNNTASGVLIRTGYSADSITVTLYGDNEGRTVREENRKVLKTEEITDRLITCPARKAEDDPDGTCARLKDGQQETRADGETGYEVTFERVIEQPGKPLVRERYYARYPMLPRKVLVGPPAPTTTTTTRPAPTSTTPPSPPPSPAASTVAPTTTVGSG